MIDVVDNAIELPGLSTDEALALLSVPDIAASHERQVLALVDHYRSWPLGLVLTSKLLRSKRTRRPARHSVRANR